MGYEDGQAREPRYFASLTSRSRQGEFRPNFAVVVTGWNQGVIGGAEGDRTPDLRIANAALCQTELLPHAENDTTVSSFRFQVASIAASYVKSSVVDG